MCNFVTIVCQNCCRIYNYSNVFIRSTLQSAANQAIQTAYLYDIVVCKVICDNKRDTFLPSPALLIALGFPFVKINGEKISNNWEFVLIQLMTLTENQCCHYQNLEHEAHVKRYWSELGHKLSGPLVKSSPSSQSSCGNLHCLTLLAKPWHCFHGA